MKKRRWPGPILLLFWLVANLNGQRLYVLDGQQSFGYIDLSDGCSFTKICDVPQVAALTDCSFHPNGRLYLLTIDGGLYALDTLDCSVQKQGAFTSAASDFYTALTADAEGVLYAAGSRLASFRPATGQFKDLGALPNPWGWASGDLTFRDGQLYLVTQQNDVLKVDIGDPSKSTVAFPLDVPTGAEVFGITTTADGCNSQQTFATVSEPGNGFFLYEVDFKKQEATKKCETAQPILGAATVNEHLVSDCGPTVNNPPAGPTFNIFLPNAFSPDDDGRNDYFTAYADAAGGAVIELLRIYDRWGGLIFEKKGFKPNFDPDGWNGSRQNRGKKVANGAYVYYCQIGFANGARAVKTGSVTVAGSDH